MKLKSSKLFRFVLLIILIAAGCSNSDEMVAFKNVNLIPMTAEQIVPNQTILIKGDRIYEIGKSDELRIPEKTKMIDGKGAYLMPGLADMHVHLTGEWPLPQLDLYLANGVTTVRDLDGRDFMLQWRNAIKTGQRTGPTIYVLNPIIWGEETDVAERILKRKSGYDSIKLYSYFSKNDFNKAMTIAKKQNLYTVGHIPFSVGLDGVIAEGMNEIAHIEELIWEFVDFDRNKNLSPEEWFPYLKKAIYQQYKPSLGLATNEIKDKYLKAVAATVKKLESKNISVCTTLHLDEVIIQKLSEPQKFLEQPTAVYLPQNYINAFLQGKEKHQRQFQGGEDFAPLKYAIDKMLLIELHQAGIPLVLGTDAGTGRMGIVPGFSIHEELRILTENGFSPYEAIQAATVNASKVVSKMIGKDDFGTIELGKRADFILLKKNPLNDVANIKNRLGVMAAGRWYGAEEIQKMIDPELLPTIPVIGGVSNIRNASGEFTTIFDVIIGQSFDGKLPDDIESITITGPEGVLPVQKDDFSFWPSANDFYIVVPGSPKVGTYKFTVTSGNRMGSTIDEQLIIRPIPVPNFNTLSPAEGEILDLKTPTFSWEAVTYFDTPIYYLFQIYDSTGEEVYRRGRTQNMTVHTVPAGILKPGEIYHWRIRISDSGHWMEEQNRSRTKRLSFRMAEKLK
jgi:imidazolonepropionase-like amidohydrolase